MKKKKLKAQNKRLIQDLYDSQKECEELREEREVTEEKVRKLLIHEKILEDTLVAYQYDLDKLNEKHNNYQHQVEHEIKGLKDRFSSDFVRTVELIRENKLQYVICFSEIQRDHIIRSAAYTELDDNFDFILTQIGNLFAEI